MIDALIRDRHDSPDTQTPLSGSAWAGEIASAPSGGTVDVKLTGYDKKLRFEDCPYMPRAATNPDDPPDQPARGDKALIVFDDNNDPWVVCWKPS